MFSVHLNRKRSPLWCPPPTVCPSTPHSSHNTTFFLVGLLFLFAGSVPLEFPARSCLDLSYTVSSKLVPAMVCHHSCPSLFAYIPPCSSNYIRCETRHMPFAPEIVRNEYLKEKALRHLKLLTVINECCQKRFNRIWKWASEHGRYVGYCTGCYKGYWMLTHLIRFFCDHFVDRLYWVLLLVRHESSGVFVN